MKWIVTILLAAIAAFGLILRTARRNPDTFTRTRPKEKKRIRVQGSVDEVFALLVERIPKKGYGIFFLEDQSRVVCSDHSSRPSMWYFFPLYLDDHGDGETMVEWGAVHRVFRFLGVPKAHLAQFQNSLEAILEGKILSNS